MVRSGFDDKSKLLVLIRLSVVYSEFDHLQMSGILLDVNLMSV